MRVDRKPLTALSGFLLIAAMNLSTPSLWSQHLSRLDREQAQTMLDAVIADLRKYYYDAKFHGVDLKEKVREAKERIAQAPSIDVAYADIAAVLESLDDSHTFFVPPPWPMREDYGWRYQMVGDRCYVTQVRPQSDAETKGVKAGDEVLTIDGFTPTRESLWKMEYALTRLLPKRSLQLVVRDPSGEMRTLDVMAEIRQTRQVIDAGDLTGGDKWGVRLDAEEQRRLVRLRYEEIGPDTMVVKFPLFFQTELKIEELIDKARRRRALILDLRGNPGGSETVLTGLVSGVFEREVKIADRVARDKTKPLMARSGRHVFSGQLIVLVDSGSASAAEAFARAVQIEKRGTILGDHTAGATMEGKYFDHRTGLNPVYTYGAAITEADLVMTDGRSLEHRGVTPDETILPTASDLAAGRDPVMARAAEIAGVKKSAEDAGKLFPYEWPKQ